MGLLIERREEVLSTFKGDIFPMKDIDDDGDDDGDDDDDDDDNQWKGIKKSG